MPDQFYPGGAGSLAYVAKKTPASAPVVPAGWTDWPGWEFPGPPWPPGWPVSVPDLFCKVIAPYSMIWCDSATIEVRLTTGALDPGGVAAISAIGQVLRLTAQLDGGDLTIAKAGGVAAAFLDYPITLYDGEHVGFLQSVRPTLIKADTGKTITWTAVSISTVPQATGTDTTLIDPDVYCICV